MLNIELSKLFLKHDIIEEYNIDNEEMIQQTTQYRRDNWELNRAIKLFGFSSGYISTGEEDDIDDEDILK
jgi:hypothetical protein